MRILWTHNFDPEKPNSQVFMRIAADGMRAAGVDVDCLYLGNLRSVRQLMAARSAVRRASREYDLVHAQYGSACGLATAGAERPKALSIRGNDWNVHDADFDFHYIHTRLARAMTRRSLAKYDAILAVSNRVGRDLQDFSGHPSVWALPSPVNLDVFLPLDKRDARTRLGYPDNDELWVLFNALDLKDPVKRFPLAQQTFALAQEALGNLRLRIATNLSHDELPLFVAACDAILCTSETEGWPNCVKEALACNVPFVATDVSDLREIAEIEGACRVCPDDPQVLADNLCSVLLGASPTNLRRHVEPMSVSSSSERLASIYESVLISHPGSLRAPRG